VLNINQLASVMHLHFLLCVITPMFCCCFIAACAQAFYAAGCKLVLCARRLDELKRVKAQLEKLRCVSNAEYIDNLFDVIFRSTHPSQPNKAGLSDCPMSICQSVRPSVHKKFFQFQRNLLCSYRSMSDIQQYAIWSRPQRSESCKNGQFQSLSPPPICM